MKEHPILFSGEMVRAILEGRKTMTRRVIRPQPDGVCQSVFVKSGIETNHGYKIKCPYGSVGDRLWVRETFTTFRAHTDEDRRHNLDVLKKIVGGDEASYRLLRGPAGDMKVLYKSDFGTWADNPDSDLGPWHPSIFMPRWASRITIEITNIRVEKLQEITEADAKAEGVHPGVLDGPEYLTWKNATDEEMLEWGGKYKDSFNYLWNSINGKKYPWCENPWVWVIEFKVVT